MFTKSDFLQVADSIKHPNEWMRLCQYPGLHYCVYPQFAFKTPDSEERICITRSRKKPDDSGVLFWLAAALCADNCFPVTENKWFEYARPYLSEGAFQSIDESEVNRLVEESCSYLLADIQLPLGGKSQFKGALMMRSMAKEFEVSIFIEYEDEFVDFNWETAA